MAQTNRNVKDSVFADLFSNEHDGKRNFLSLYNALHGTHLKYEETVIENKTIPQSMYKTFHNDVSMLIDNKLIVMIEHQSTINENMPFRLLEYVTRIYEGIVPDRSRYSEKRICIPTPEFYVFYNGTRKYPDEKILKLSDSFIQRYEVDDTFPQLELSVRVINIGPRQTLKFQDGCGILDQYCSDYLSRNATEVINMFLAEYDYETDISVKCEEAREDKAIEAAVTLIQKYNEQPETAAQVMGAPLDKVLEALANK